MNRSVALRREGFPLTQRQRGKRIVDNSIPSGRKKLTTEQEGTSLRRTRMKERKHGKRGGGKSSISPPRPESIDRDMEEGGAERRVISYSIELSRLKKGGLSLDFRRRPLVLVLGGEGRGCPIKGGGEGFNGREWKCRFIQGSSG